MSYSQIRKKCNKCGYDATHYTPKYHINRKTRKRCDGTYEDVEVFNTNAINRDVLKYLVENYGRSLDRNTRIQFGNSVMYALGAEDQQQPVVNHFWEQFEQKQSFQLCKSEKEC